MSVYFPKKVLITGATGALGQEVIAKFLQEECEITGVYSKSKPDLQSAVNWLQLELSDSEQVRKALKNSPYDTLIHCAGGFRYSTVEQMSDEDFEFLLNSNLKSAFHVVREILPEMKKRNFGRIAFVSSQMTLNPKAGMAPYAASKAGLNMLTQALAEEVKEYNITVNAVLPSIIDSPVNRKDMPNSKFSDWVSPKQLADILYSLVSPWGNPIHGALIPIAGRV